MPRPSPLHERSLGAAITGDGHHALHQRLTVEHDAVVAEFVGTEPQRQIEVLGFGVIPEQIRHLDQVPVGIHDPRPLELRCVFDQCHADLPDPPCPAFGHCMKATQRVAARTQILTGATGSAPMVRPAGSS